MLRRHLNIIGNSFGIIIPKIYLEEMGINPVLHDVEIEVRNKVLLVRKAEKEEN